MPVLQTPRLCHAQDYMIWLALTGFNAQELTKPECSGEFNAVDKMQLAIAIPPFFLLTLVTYRSVLDLDRIVYSGSF